MTEHNRLVENIQTKMAFYVSNLLISNDRDYFDENKEAEYFFCKPLSLLFDADVTNANTEQRNFPGIDLADKKEGISFQITSTNTKKKVQHTLDEFLAHSLDDDFERLIVLIVTLDTPPKCANLKFQREFDFNVKRDVWNISRLVQEFADLADDKRHLLQAFSDYLDQELPNIEPQKPHLELPLSSKLQASGFVGREAELNEIRSRFAQGDKLVVLTGLGGIGKTELAIRYGQMHPGKVYFTRFDTSFTRTLANMAQGIRPRLPEDVLREDDGALSKRVLELLEKADPQDLLIIDNADSETGTLTDLQGDSGYVALTKLPLTLLLTTRSDTPRDIPVEPMPDTALTQIFRNHNAQLTDQEMVDLIRTVNSHTMTIDLIARTLNGRGWRKVSAADLLTALRNNILSSRKYQKIATDYNQSPEQAQIYTHLSVVFDVSGISDDGRTVLRCATLLPDGGMDSECFGHAFNAEGQDALDILLERGWLEIKNGLITIHPVIRLVCWTELPPTDEECNSFLNGMVKQYDENNYQKDRFRQMAELLTNASRYIADPQGVSALWAGTMWKEVGVFTNACECELNAIKKQEVNLAPDSPELARSYNNVGGTYSQLGDHNKALEYQLKALMIWEKVYPGNHPDLAACYNNVGGTYNALGDHRKELEYLLKALAIRETIFPADHLDLANSYNNISGAYCALGNSKTELEYQLKAIAIREKVLPADHPSLALSYNNVGLTYSDLGDSSKALEYLLKAMVIREKVLPADHPELAQSYNNMSSIYHSLGEHRKALEFMHKSISILETVLPGNHPHLAISYNNIAGIHHNLGNLQEAARYMRQAADIINRSSLPQSHPHRINYPQWADQFEKDARMQQAIIAQMREWGMGSFCL